MPKKTGLGRGLDALFAENQQQNEISEQPKNLRISDIQPRSGQPRKSFDQDSLSSLAESIAANGLIQPIVVRRVPAGYYEIVAGERRWRAAKLAGLTEVPVVVLDLDDRTTAEISLIENIQREDLNPVEEAYAFRALLTDYGFSQEELAGRIGKSRPAIANKLRLLELPSITSSMLASGDITEGHARALLGLKDRSLVDETARKIYNDDLSVRQTEKLVARLNTVKAPVQEPAASVMDVDYIAELEKRIRRAIGRKVRISNGRRVKTVEIEYTDNDDLNALLGKLCGEDFLNE